MERWYPSSCCPLPPPPPPLVTTEELRLVRWYSGLAAGGAPLSQLLLASEELFLETDRNARIRAGARRSVGCGNGEIPPPSSSSTGEVLTGLWLDDRSTGASDTTGVCAHPDVGDLSPDVPTPPPPPVGYVVGPVNSSLLCKVMESWAAF